MNRLIKIKRHCPKTIMFFDGASPFEARMTKGKIFFAKD